MGCGLSDNNSGMQTENTQKPKQILVTGSGMKSKNTQKTKKSPACGMQTTNTQKPKLGLDTGSNGNDESSAILSYLNKFEFIQSEMKLLPGKSSKQYKDNKEGDKQSISNDDALGNIALVSMFYSNFCYTDGTYNNNDLDFQKGYYEVVKNLMSLLLVKLNFVN